MIRLFIVQSREDSPMTTAQSATHTTVTLPASGASDKPSIREIMLGGIMRGTPKEEILAQVQKHHPASAGAEKFKVHLAWYKGWLKNKATPKDIATLRARFGLDTPAEELQA